MLQRLFLVILCLIFILGIICITINITLLERPKTETKTIYKYIPRTFEEEQREQPFVSDMFKTMFTQQSPWVNSIMDYDRRKQERVNQWYISQV